MDMFVLLAIPLFTLAGNLMNAGGISARLIALVKSLIGHVSGGLAQVNIGASIGSVSVASLFLAGVFPGLLLGFSLMIAAYIYAKRKKITKHGRFVLSDFLTNFYRAIPALLFPLIILYGILGGIFTPTEAAAIAVVYAVIIGFFVHRELTLKKLADNIIDTGILLGALAPIISTAAIFPWILGAESASTAITKLLFSFSHNKYVILFIINVFLLLVGTVLETAAAIILCTPILLPIAVQLGVAPVHFSAILVLNLIIGLSTPPVGVCLFISCRIASVSLEKISRAAFPFLIVAIIVLMIITYQAVEKLGLPVERTGIGC